MSGKLQHVDVPEAHAQEVSSTSSITNNPPSTFPQENSSKRKREIEDVGVKAEGNGKDEANEVKGKDEAEDDEIEPDLQAASLEDDLTAPDHDTSSTSTASDDDDENDENERPLNFAALWTPADISHPDHRRWLATLAKRDEAARAVARNEVDSDSGSELSPPPASLKSPSPPPTATAAEEVAREATTSPERRRREREENPRQVDCRHTDWCDCPMHAGWENGVRICHLGEWALRSWSDGTGHSGVRGTLGKEDDDEAAGGGSGGEGESE